MAGRAFDDAEPVSRHHGPHSRPNRHEERQKGKTAKPCEGRARFGQAHVGIEQEVGMRLKVPVPQIHQQECKVIQDVDRRQILIEFDGVKKCRYAIDHYDIAQMKIAMASPDKAPTSALAKQRSQRPQLRSESLRECRHFLFRKVRHGFLERTGYRCHDAFHHPRYIEAAAFGCRSVRIGDPLCQCGHELERQRAAKRQCIKHVGLIETAHLHGPFDNRPIAVNRQ